jgi:hypothetical protein
MTGTKTGQKILLGVCFFSLIPFVQANHLRISGSGELQIARGNIFETSETWNQVILTDGVRYKIKAVGAFGTIRITHEVGSDGTDTYMVSDGRESVLAQASKTQISGAIFSGVYPKDCSVVLQTAWLGYCSENFFVEPDNQTGLALSALLLWTPAGNITNIPTFFPDRKLPQTIVGWSKNEVHLPGKPAPSELKQYPGGFKVWEFHARNSTNIGGFSVAQELTMEGFAPKPPPTATTGADTTLTRRIRFVTTSIEELPGVFDPLPDVPIPDMLIEDQRFLEDTKDRVLVSTTVSNRWPTRSSPEIKNVEKMVLALKQANEFDEGHSPKPRWIIVAFLLASSIGLYFLVKNVGKAKNTTQG